MTAFRTLLWKEWLAMRPFAILVAALFLVGLVMAFFTEFLDEYPIWNGMFGDSVDLVTTLFVLSAIVGRGLAVREREEGTLNFLDGVPVSRCLVYFAKWLMAVAILVGVFLLWNLEYLVYQWLSLDSVSEPTPWRSILVMVGMQIFLICYFVSGWCAISCWRRWDLLILGGIVLTIRWVSEAQIPFADWLNPFALIKIPDEQGDFWPIPWGHLSVLTVAGIGSWLIGLVFFASRDSFWSRLAKQLKESWWGPIAVCLPFVLIPGVWIAFLWTSDPSLFEDGEGDDIDQSELTSGFSDLKNKETKYFDFVYRAGMAKKLEPVIKAADETWEQVSSFLEMPDDLIKGRIVVDLSSPIGQHNAGQAYWKKIRMILPRKFDAKDNIAVLGHEITHVIIDQITDGRASDSFPTTRWFHEGLASYIEHRFFAKQKGRDDMDRWSALAATWGEIKFSEMVRNSHFSAKRDTNLVYPAGGEWVAALVDVYGDNAPAKLLQSMGRKDAPKKILGLTFWRDTCLVAGFDLERINARFRERLTGLKEQYAKECAKFPELTEATVTRENGKLVIRPDLSDVKIPKGAKIVCRVRSNKDAVGWEMRQAILSKDKAFRLSGLAFPGPTVDYQIGWIPGKWLSLPVMGEWVDATVEKKQ